MVPPSVWHGLGDVSGLRAGGSAARETEPIQPVAVEIVEATLPHLSPVVAAMIHVQLLTGARPGEVCSMRGIDLDTNGKLWTYTPAHHKTEHQGQERTIMIGPVRSRLSGHISCLT
jgi:integrase